MSTSKRAPRRILIILRDSSRHWSKGDAEVIDAALQLIPQGVPGLENYKFVPDDHMFIAKEMFGTITLFIVDIFNNAYNLETAHEEGKNDLPLITVRFSNKKETASIEGPPIEKRTNQQIRELHNSVGFGIQPPFFVDHTNNRVPTYPRPRTVVYSTS